MASDDWVEADAPQSWGAYLGETGSDAARSAANAVTFGMADRALGYALGTGTEAEVAKSEAARARSPYASVAGDVAGSLAIPGFGAAGLAARMGGRLGARALAYGVTGAATGAAQGAGTTYTGKPEDYVNNAITGAAIGGPLGAIGGAAFGRGPARSAAVTPDAAELGRATDVAYDTFRGLPARYTPASFADAGQDANVALRAAGHFDAPTTHGGSPVPFRAVDQMQAPPTAVNPVTGANAHISPRDIDVVRRGTTGDRIAGLDPWHQAGAGIVRHRIDDFVTNPPPGAVVPGTEAAAQQAGGIYQTARNLHAGTMRTEAMEELIRNSERQAGSTHSGLNLRNELQKAVKARLKEKSGESSFSKAGYNPAELAQFDRFSRGQGAVSRGLGWADKYLGGGGGLGAMAATGVAGGGIGQYFKDDPEAGVAAGLGAAGAGLGLRVLGNRRAAADINHLRDLIAQRNPLYAARVARAPMVPGPGAPLAAKAVRDVIATEIIKQRQRPDGADEWE